MAKMIVQQPQPFVVATDSNQWSSGICNCTEDMASCCFAFWCFPCFACKTSRDYGECLCLPLLDSFGLIPPITLSMRVSMRQRYGILGSICNDCLYSFFCGPCVWCQMSREMKMRLQPITLVNARAK
ncbi:cornifelin homolog B-like [Megalops cyprinoides]|uniref:cornifelin homolog B-like n=1 Tax=Megalops cyprinoides TaxID=118141 RepID=UPI001864198A|nr:cornifelin homolog B-like [Megalops cyprinoides]